MSNHFGALHWRQEASDERASQHECSSTKMVARIETNATDCESLGGVVFQAAEQEFLKAPAADHVYPKFECCRHRASYLLVLLCNTMPCYASSEPLRRPRGGTPARCQWGGSDTSGGVRAAMALKLLAAGLPWTRPQRTAPSKGGA